MRKPLYTAIIATLMSAPLLAGGGDKDKHAKLDTDGDGVVSRAEFQAYLDEKDLHSQADLDGDGYISQEEFDAMDIEFVSDEQRLSDWDVDADNQLSDVEFREGLYLAFEENETRPGPVDEWEDTGDTGLADG